MLLTKYVELSITQHYYSRRVNLTASYNTHGMYPWHEWLIPSTALTFTYTYIRVVKAAFCKALATAVIASTSILLLLRLDK